LGLLNANDYEYLTLIQMEGGDGILAVCGLGEWKALGVERGS
jgi:hypothetical protein